MERVADYIIQRLVDQGIKHLPLITGRGILYLSDAVAKNPNIAPIPVHHEQAAAYAAVAYSQYNGHLGACLVSTGCASTNTMTGVLNAWQDGIPTFFLSGQNWLKETVNYTGKPIRTFGSQEADIIPIVRPITKYAEMLKDPKQVGVVMDKALYYATHGVKGPVWLDVPVDVQNMRVEPAELERWNIPIEDYAITTEDLQFTVDALNKAKRPVVLIGNGVRSANAVEEFRNMVENVNIPVVFSASAVDTYGTKNSLSIGTVAAIGGTRAGNFTVQNADFILSLGCRLSPMTTGSQYEKFAREAKIIVIDIDENEHSKETVKIDKFIKADVKDAIIELLNANIKKVNQTWVDKCLHWKTIFPKCEDAYKHSELADLYNIAVTLSETLADDAVILCDAGMEELITPTVIDYGNNQRCLHPASQGCMGVALPAAMGAYWACGHAVTTVIGDGSVMMNIQELQTIAFNKIPIRIIVVNNGIYSVIRKRQKELFRTRTVGVDTSNGVSIPDFKKLAECFGLQYMRISGTADLKRGFEKLQTINEPIICEVMAVEDQEYLRTSAAFNVQRRFVSRPIEDLFPWMDRETFTKEMIVEPIDL
ncbi:thiamine pyrophosphate-binding protein [Bacteroides sp.]|uniref:thiamine pyrophosphate-binding protein n=1 Tax=Bacteroides sp. TaxID=29523 RepID=UPI00262F14F9|nr:thiamine pyrophosphate-binding protein [Bacteroides sp.]